MDDRPRVSLTMIVRDEEHNLPRLLDSVAGLFDDVVIVDTGSTDRTREIARGYGARVYDFRWCEDFAAARNESLRHAAGDYAMWLDADDVIEPSERPKLRALFDRLDSDGALYVLSCNSDPVPGSTLHNHIQQIRLFPRRDWLTWKGRAHEEIEPIDPDRGVTIRHTDITIRHTGYTDPGLLARKHDRDQALYRLDLVDHPDDPDLLYRVGHGELLRGNYSAAAGLLWRSLDCDPEGYHVARLIRPLSLALVGLDQIDEAARVCEVGLRNYPDDPEVIDAAEFLGSLSAD